MKPNTRFIVSLILASLWIIWGVDVIMNFIPGVEWWWKDLRATFWMAPFALFFWWGTR